MRALAGEDANRDPLAVYIEKTRDLPEVDEPTEAMRIGSFLEPLALQFLAEKLDKPIFPGTTYRSSELPHMGASIDGNIFPKPRHEGTETVHDGRIGIAEAKTVGLSKMREWRDGPPPSCLIQVIQQMIVTGHRSVHVVEIESTSVRFFEVEYDDSLANALVELGGAFWHRHIIPRRPPEPSPTPAGKRALRSLYPRVRHGVILASDEQNEIAREYFEALTVFEEAERRMNAAENALKMTIGEFKGVDGDGFRSLWYETRGRIDYATALQALLPGLDKKELEPFRGEGHRTLKVTPK